MSSLDVPSSSPGGNPTFDTRDKIPETNQQAPVFAQVCNEVALSLTLSHPLILSLSLSQSHTRSLTLTLSLTVGVFVILPMLDVFLLAWNRNLRFPNKAREFSLCPPNP